LASFAAVQAYEPQRTRPAQPTMTVVSSAAASRRVAINAPGTSNDLGAWQHRYRIQEGHGALSDTTVAVKDCVATGGVPMSLGMPHIRYQPRGDAAIVRALLDAGATLV